VCMVADAHFRVWAFAGCGGAASAAGAAAGGGDSAAASAAAVSACRSPFVSSGRGCSEREEGPPLSNVTVCCLPT
jgi:hypothetical protein